MQLDLNLNFGIFYSGALKLLRPAGNMDSGAHKYLGTAKGL